MDRRAKKINKKMNNTWFRLPRINFLLLKDGVLTQEEFLLYLFYISITVWHSDNEDYGIFTISNKNAALFLGLRSESSISRNRNSLIRKGFLKHIDRGVYSPKKFETFLPRSRPKMHDDLAKKHDDSEFLGDELAKTHDDQLRNDISSLGSSKGNLSSFDDKHNQNIDLDDLPF